MKQVGILVALMLVWGCEKAPSTSDPQRKQETAGTAERSTPDVPAPTDQRRSRIGTTSKLSAHTSSLTGAVSDFAVERTDFGSRVQLAADTLFEFDQPALAPAAAANLERTADLIRQGGHGTVTITGHTDSKGDDEYNLALSRRRAEAVAAWLRKQSSLNERRFTVVGRGEAEPIAPNETANGTDDPEGRARNRRVTVDIPR